MEAYTSFAQVYDLFMDNVPYEEWSRYIIGLMKEYGICDGTVLDLGCGTGKITRLLKKAGYDMIGVDNSEEMLAEAIEKKADAQKRMGEASILEMYLAALPEVVKNAAAPLSQTEKIVMYGDGNSTKLVRDIIASANQVADGMRESTGIDLQALIAGFAGGKAAREAEIG